MNGNIYQRLCSIFNFDEETQKLSFGIDMQLKQLEKKDVYKTLLFEFCFLIKKGSVNFKELNDLWIFKVQRNKELDMSLEMINILIKLIEKKIIAKEAIINAVINLLQLNNYEMFMIFKILQSIYSNYNNYYEYLVFPLIYTLGFGNDFIKSLLKQDLIAIMDEFLKKLDMQEEIVYSDINVEFIHDLNNLIYYIKHCVKGSKKEKNAFLLYKHLCSFSKIYQKSKDLDEINPIS